MCQNGRIVGAVKKGKLWLIPDDVNRPADGRRSISMVNDGPGIDGYLGRKSLPIGVSDFAKAVSDYYYVDKTLLIKDIIDDMAFVSLFTRPRRFGKTLNMDMLRVFFELSGEDTSVYFKDKAVWCAGEKYRRHQGKYPVIMLSFKDTKYDTWDAVFRNICMLVSEEYRRHAELISSRKVDDVEKENYKLIADGRADEVLMGASISLLCTMLFKHYGQRPIVIIDEYDTPIEQGHLYDYYDKAIGFMRNLFSDGFKDNSNLSFGFLTGVLRVAKDCVFSGLNNLTVYSVLDEKYSSYFGFTESEISEMCKYYDCGNPEEIREWYDGYIFGREHIYNPWSIANYFNMGAKARAYWQSTGSNEIIGEIMEYASEDEKQKLYELLCGRDIYAKVDTNIVYLKIKDDPSNIYSFLLVAGYLTAEESEITNTGDPVCRLSLPNKEIRYVYNKEILERLKSIMPGTFDTGIQEAIYSGNVMNFQRSLTRLLHDSASYYDTVKELYYQGLLLGLCASLSSFYEVTSNNESGEGRYDIGLIPLRKEFPGIIIEIKYEKNASEEKLKKSAKEAIGQINDKKYDSLWEKNGIKNVLKYGVAFSGKNVCVLLE